MRKTIIAGNWKMNNTRKEASALTEALVKGVQGNQDCQKLFSALPLQVCRLCSTKCRALPFKLVLKIWSTVIPVRTLVKSRR